MVCVCVQAADTCGPYPQWQYHSPKANVRGPWASGVSARAAHTSPGGSAPTASAGMVNVDRQEPAAHHKSVSDKWDLKKATHRTQGPVLFVGSHKQHPSLPASCWSSHHHRFVSCQLRTQTLTTATVQDSAECVMATLTQLKALRLADCTVRDGERVSYTRTGLGNDVGVLPGLTRLQAASQLSRGLIELQGFINMQQVTSLFLFLFLSHCDAGSCPVCNCAGAPAVSMPACACVRSRRYSFL